MPKLIVVTGATATGKSDLAISLAQELGAEIVNADSMQLYRGMDIGTAKLSLAERAGIPHHLLDVVDVDTDVSVSWYQESARAIIDALLAANKSVVVVGGTGLYIKAILDDLNFPETDPAVRAAITTEAGKLGNEAMHKRLSTLDPAAALAIPQENIRRVIRALEVIEITGKPYTANLPREASSKYPHAKQFGLVMDRETLDIRIDARVNQMWQLGFVDEVETLINQGILDGKTARAAIGYAQIIKLKHGEMSEPEAKEDTARATRQYARRQETWFSRDMRIQWIKPGAPEERLSTALSSL
ncbi:MAG: tRNA (adenosine(37)-N6)-dimethylallyltransferase MiaA [Actinobacteria bacterium]|uniref:tRNA dimethylallyltransferase n=1 Tax=freshwater metagenome TaxID=449393 RepID=A0A6J6AY86_9ZZZZ|nr:tRNA (adenosine(37)-N6)-dimethylallyltransferase MiaA [Actinomycetota bacterium]